MKPGYHEEETLERHGCLAVLRTRGLGVLGLDHRAKGIALPEVLLVVDLADELGDVLEEELAGCRVLYFSYTSLFFLISGFSTAASAVTAPARVFSSLMHSRNSCSSSSPSLSRS